MIGKKINQLATELAPVSTDLTIIGDPISGVSKKITLAQLGAIFSGAVSFYNDLASFPTTGDINVIYCAKDTQKLYLWSGSAYTEVFPSQALLNTYQLRSEKGVSNGYASLDSGGKVPISQLPSSIMEYKGTWSAATNTPTLANGTGDTGDVYLCNAAGSVNFGAGPITFAVGDYVVYSGSIYQRSSGAVGTVTSVGLSITGNAIGVSNSPITTSGTLALAFAGTNLQYINGVGSLTTFPSLTGFVPYTGATGQVNLGAYDLLVQTLTIGKGNSGLSNNTALGYRTLFHITTGNYNTAVGYEAAHNTTTGQYNTALGQSALFTNTTGSQNTALGLNALLSNTTGGSNVVVGLDALQHNTTGSSNTALGYNAGSHITGGSTPNTTASNSVYIGRDSKAKVDGGANEIVIGYNAIGNGSNTATFGNTSTTANYFTGSINGGSFVKSGGTSAQFLKADGSVDSNTYLTTSAASSTYLPLILNSSANTVDINGQQFTIQGSAGGFTSGRIIVDPVFSALGYQNSGVFDGLKILTNGNAEFTNSGITRFFNQVRFDSTLTNGTYTYTLPGASGTIALVGGAGVGTVTSVGLSSATSGVTIGATPVTTSGTITLAIATASGSQQGLLSSTDWTTFNNKQNALTNPVTGSGTTNYLPKFTGASTIGNSIVYDDGSGIGITGSAYATLTLNSTNANGWGTNINFQQSGTAFGYVGAYGSLVGSTTKDMTIWANSGNGFRVNVNNSSTSALILNTSGSLGLGVTPTDGYGGLQIVGPTSGNILTQLGIDGVRAGVRSSGNTAIVLDSSNTTFTNRMWYLYNAGASGSLIIGRPGLDVLTFSNGGNLGLGVTPANSSYKNIQNGLAVMMGSSADAGAYWNANSTFDAGWKYIINGSSSRYEQGGGSHSWHTAPSGTAGNAISFTQAMTLDASGRLGIGNTNMSSFDSYGNQLVVGNGSTNQGITIYASTSTESSLYFADGTGAASYRGYIYYRHSNDSMFFGTNAATALTLASTGAATFSSSVTATQGNFSLGTVGGAIGSVKNLTVANSAGNLNDWAGLNFAYYNNTTNFGYIGTIVTSEATNGKADMVFGVKANTSSTSVTEYMRIQAGGNVGIGTTSPNSPLEVYGQTRVSASGGSVFLITPNATSTNGIVLESSYYGTAGYGPMNFHTGGTERMRITSGGNVGIGTTNPSYPLQVRRAGGGGSLGISIDGVGSTDRTVQYFAIQDSASGAGAGHAFYYRPASSTTDTLGLLLNEDGNVGIGTTSPSEKLEVNGNIKTAAPSGGSAGSWKLGTFTSGSATIGGKVRVEINGVAYDLLTT